MMLALRLKELRKRKNLTQEQLADIIRVERSSVGKYEGKSEIIPSVDILQRIADVFDTTIDYLLGRTDDEERSSTYSAAPDSDLSAPNGDMSALRERLRRQPGMRILFDASKNATEKDLLEAARLIESFKKIRDGEE